MDDNVPIIRLVVNADDFGIDPEVSNGILEAHRAGIVTSTSILGNCADPSEAHALLAAAPLLGVGGHLTLVGGRPVSPSTDIPALVTDAGTFSERPRDLYLKWAKGALPVDEVEREFDAQVTRLGAAGLKLDHLNTHHHLGFLPPVGRALEAVARRHRIAGIRMAVERPNLAWLTEARRGAIAAALGTLAWFTRHQMGALRHGPETWGYVESGRLDTIRILEILGRLGPGAHELICHPGQASQKGGHDRRRELEALCAPIVRRAIEARGIRLCRWADLF
jgi:predicted glycoside hydrolase/deacetylase ChbG (UPF0249 family)